MKKILQKTVCSNVCSNIFPFEDICHEASNVVVHQCPFICSICFDIRKMLLATGQRLQSMERVQFKIQAFQISALVCVSTLNGHMSHGVSDRDKKC